MKSMKEILDKEDSILRESSKRRHLTHFKDLDEITNGFHDSNLIVLGARVAMGKTALALNIVENMCFKNNISIGIFSLEMNHIHVIHRIISSMTEIEIKNFNKDTISKDEFKRVSTAIDKLRDHEIVIEDAPGLSINEIASIARTMKKVNNIEFLVIDYFQLIDVSKKEDSPGNSSYPGDEVVRKLKCLAQELKIPILCLSQLSRKVLERSGHRPLLSDLFTSALQDHADVVLLLSRRDYYDPNDKPGTADLLIAKNRNGEIANIKLVFVREFTQFKDYAPIKLEDDYKYDESMPRIGP